MVFDVKEGPQVKVRNINFNGNVEVSDRAIGRQMKGTKAYGWLSWVTGKGKYRKPSSRKTPRRSSSTTATRATSPPASGSRRSRCSRTAPTARCAGATRRADRRGPRYKVGDLAFDGNKVVKTEFLQPLFKLKKGDWYSDKPIRNGLIEREIYGQGGYFEFTVSRPRSAGSRHGTAGRSAEPTVNVTMRMQEGEQYFVNRLTFVGNTTTRDNVIRRDAAV